MTVVTYCASWIAGPPMVADRNVDRAAGALPGGGCLGRYTSTFAITGR